MPYTLDYNPQKHRFITIISSVMDPDELEVNDREILESPHFSKNISLLNIIKPGCDVGKLTIGIFNERFVPLLEKTAEQRLLIGKVAWVVPSDLMVPIFKLWMSLPEVQKLQTFRFFTTRSEAEDWLNEQ